MKLWISTFGFIMAAFLSCVSWGYPYNIPFQFLGATYMILHYSGTKDEFVQAVANGVILCFHVAGIFWYFSGVVL